MLQQIGKDNHIVLIGNVISWIQGPTGATEKNVRDSDLDYDLTLFDQMKVGNIQNN